MGKMIDWEIWMAQAHPPVQKYASPEYINNPDNWGPPMPKYKEMMERLSPEELLRTYIQIDASSPSRLSWRRALCGTVGPASTTKAGTPALNTLKTSKHKYAACQRTSHHGRVGRTAYAASRVVYYLTHGTWPEVVDHIDNNPLNNAPENLRASTHAKNAQNRKSGQTKGFYWNKSSSKFHVRLAGVYLAQVDDMLTARAIYVRAYFDKYKHLPQAG